MVDAVGQEPAWRQTYEAASEAVQSFPRFLADVPLWQLVLFIPVGLVSLLYGLKLFKGMVVVYAAMVGVLAGWLTAARFALSETIGMIGGAVVLGLLAWPLFKVAVSIFGGVAGGLLGAMVVFWLDKPVYVLIAGGIGLVLGFILALVIFRAVIIFMTSVLGAVLVVLGVVGLVMAVPSVREAVITGIEAKRFLLPVLIGVPAVIGAIYQVRQTEREERKAPKKK